MKQTNGHENAFLKTAFLVTLLAALLAAVFVLFALPQQAYASTGLTVYVGYSGGPYYEKKSYSDADIQALSSATYTYTALDNMPALRQVMGRGVTLEALASNCGINISQVSRFHFVTSDSYKTDDGVNGTTGWSYNQLVGTAKYYYPDFKDYYDDVKAGLSATAVSNLEASRQAVPTILAYESYDYRVLSDADLAKWGNTSLMDGAKRYRLLFGQTSPTEVTANLLGSGIKGVIFVLGGTPTINNAPQDFSGKVGDSYTFHPTLSASDATVSANGVKDIKWYSTNPEAATVVVNDDGSVTVTIVGNGSFSIRGTFGNSPSNSFVANATAGKGTGTGGTNAPSNSIEAMGLVGETIYRLTSNGSYVSAGDEGAAAEAFAGEIELVTIDNMIAAGSPSAALIIAVSVVVLVALGGFARVRMFKRSLDPAAKSAVGPAVKSANSASPAANPAANSASNSTIDPLYKEKKE